MKVAAAFSLFFASAAAFAPAATRKSSAALQAVNIDEAFGVSVETGGKCPPLGAKILEDTTPAALKWFQNAEIKHGRVAMFAFVGYIVHANGIKFPWAMQMDGAAFPSETNPPALWDAISDSAKWQIFGAIAFLEFWSELSTPSHTHYMNGGKPGDFPDFVSGPEGIPHPVPFNLYDPFKISKNMSEETKEKRLRAEINNGRLAQIGILGFLAEQTTPGSVPLLSGIVQSYDGEPMAPFATNVIGAPFGL
mmetsp:Transcript_33626/g.47773  ORF Transcript_33626/g.47773 Transcript_33626/m.47773 type:complete len:250 (+) Transcript_33626:86-835(+)